MNNSEDKKDLTATPQESDPAATAVLPRVEATAEQLSAIGDAARGAAVMLDNVEKLKRLLAYPGSDQSDRRECSTFIEVGGPSTHVKIGALTRPEINLLDVAITGILANRHAAYRTEMARLCAQIGGAL